MQYPTIAQPQYGFGPTMPPGMYDTPPALMNFKEGGLASLAEKVQSAGRNGDTMLAHITPEEVGILKAFGGSGTINPKTGLPEFFLKKAFKSITKALAPIIKPLAPIIPFLPIPGLGPLSSLATKALLTGIASGVDKSGSFNLKKGLTTGALTYGLGSLLQNLQAAQGAPNAAGTGGTYDISDVIDPNAAVNLPTLEGGIPTDTGAAIYDAGATSVVTPTTAPSVEAAVKSSVGTDTGAAMQPGGIAGAEPIAKAQPSIMEKVTEGISNLPSNALDYISSLPGKALDYAVENPVQAALMSTTAYGSVKSLQELDKQKEEAERILAAQEGKKASDIAWAQGVLRDYPINYRRLTAEDVRAQQGMAGGGLASLNAFKSGGNPRFLKGGGDGMSDDIPATIGGRQKARLSDGEFVIPADVVSHLGNGSSRAGAKKLYKMMDNIRRARTGKRRQAPEVSADRYMPA